MSFSVKINTSVCINTDVRIGVGVGISIICFSSSRSIHVSLRIRSIARMCSLLMLHFLARGLLGG